MMSMTIWISSDEARAFYLTTSGVTIRRYHRHGPRHHAVEHGKNHTTLEDQTKFFHEVADVLHLRGNERFLIVGPGLAKTHFQKYLESHLPSAAARIAGVENMDKATDGEILDFAHRYFKKIDVFESLRTS